MIRKYKKRQYYLDLIEPFIDTDLIKVLVGQRRVGKSYILYQIIDKILAKNKKANIIYINREDNKFDDIRNYQNLLDYIEVKIKKNQKNYLFIDEIQDIENFEKALRHLSSKKYCDIYCSGSNAKLLSSEIATGLSGRYIEFVIHSLSYKEFIKFNKFKANEESLLKYIRYGGLPYLLNLKLEDNIVYNYLKAVYSSIILKDVVARYNIRNINFLNRLTYYLADNLGSLVSSKKINDFLKSQKTAVTPNKVLDYISYLRSSFFIHEASRFDIKGKKIFEINKKYYFNDLGLRNAVKNYQSSDIAQVLENLVYLHLIRFGYNVNIGQLGNKEIDFVAEKSGKKIYIQVAYLIDYKETKDREFNNLLAINDNYEKIVVSMDKLIAKDHKGIKHMHIIDFLLKDF